MLPLNAPIHNALIDAGWSPKNSINYNTYMYTNSVTNNPYDEFILNYTAANELVITVPIQFRNNSMAYKNIFSTDNLAVILAYLKIHLENYKLNA